MTARPIRVIGKLDRGYTLYWAEVVYHATPRSDRKFNLETRYIHIIDKVNGKKPTVEPSDLHTIHLDDIVWDARNKDIDHEPPDLTEDGSANIGDYLLANYLEIFKPAHVLN